MKFACKFVLNKQNKISFVNYVINNIMKRCMFSVNNPYFNRVIIFNSEGNEVTCSKDDLNECINDLEQNFLITMWRENESIDLIFYLYDDKYDVFEITFYGLEDNEANEIFNDILTVIFENGQSIIGIAADKKDLLSDICFKYNDSLCLDFLFNLKSSIRKEVHKIIGYNLLSCDFSDTYRQINDSLGSIYTFNFLTKGHILIEIFDYK